MLSRLLYKKIESNLKKIDLPLVCCYAPQKHIFLSLNQPYLSILYQALFATAYYGLFRVSEITKSNHILLVQDVHSAINKKKLLFILRSSKTHNKSNKPQLIKITSEAKNIEGKNRNEHQTRQTTFCLYDLINNYISCRPGFASCTEQFFVFSDKSPLHPYHMRSTLKLLLKTSGFQDTAYSMHSLRIGHCSDLLAMGLSVETIKKIGRW